MSEAVVQESNVEVNQITNEPAKPESKPIVRICAHIKDDGLPCGTPAVNGRNFCYYHCRAHHPGARIATRRYRSPIPESIASLQIALAHTMQALASGDITPKQAGTMMYGINLGTNLLRLAKPLTEADKQQLATDIPEELQDVLVGPEDEPGSESTIPPHVPDSMREAVRVVEREIRNLRAMTQPADQLRIFQDDLRKFQGTTDPRYNIAVNRIYEHDYASKKLRQRGLSG